MSERVQKEFKKRLKAMMSRPENQVCADCPERQPRWASLIVPPPGAPEGTLPIGALICLECSGSHRRLGVHLTFVRSINLDSWKEKEVLAMENGGNMKVNAIFETHMPQGVKPQAGADLNTRQHFIKDKYERRKYYDPSALANYKETQAARPVTAEEVAKSGSELAQKRAMAKKKKEASPTRQVPGRSRSGNQKMSAARARRLQRATGTPTDQPKNTVKKDAVVDLLDLSADPGPTSQVEAFSKSDAWAMDFFSADAGDDGDNPKDAFNGFASVSNLSRTEKSPSRSRNRSKSRSSKSPKKEAEDDGSRQGKRNSVDNIMAMYNTPQGNAMDQMNMRGNQSLNFPTNGNDKAMGGYQARLMTHQTLMMQQMQQQMQQMRLSQQGGAMPGMMNPMMQQQQQMQMMNPMMQQQMQMMNPMMQQQMQMMGGMQPGMGMQGQLRNNFPAPASRQMSISDLATRPSARPSDKNDPFASLG